MIKLTLTEKGGEPRLLTFDKDEVTIGRVSGNDIVLAKGNVSKRHSKLVLRGGQIEVSDLKSTNGTFVNGRKIGGPTTLSGSDRIYVGDFLIGIEMADGVAEAGSASRRLAPPPPPPPPPRSRSSASRMPAEDDDLEMGTSSEEEDELAARPPGSGRVPLPPPPPPRRPATPLANRALLEEEDEMPPSEANEDGGNYEDTGSVGLFAHSRAEDDLDGVNRRSGTGSRPVPAAPGMITSPNQPMAAPLSDVSGAGVAPGFEALLADPAVTHILVIGPDAALVDRGEGLKLHPDTLGDANAVADTLWRYANTAYPPPPPDNPVVDVRLPDGTRISAAFPPAAPAGVVGSIRRPGLPERPLSELVPGGSTDVQALLETVAATRRNLLITGDANAVTAALGALAGALPPDHRVVAIGALARSRSGWSELTPAGDMPGLLRVAAALRADHLVLGELVGPEASELALVAARGQDGIIVALPGRGAVEVLANLTALAAAGLGGTATAAALVAATFDLVLHVAATPDGGARLIEVSEPRSEGATVVVDVALSLSGEGARRDLAGGRLQGRGVSARLATAVAAAGSTLPSALVAK
jgi:pilus assembly protein CpaF